MINHQRYVSLFLITVLFVSLLSFSTPQNDEVLEEIDLPKYASSAGDSPHGGERVKFFSFPDTPGYAHVYNNDGTVRLKIEIDNLTIGEEYTIEWIQERYGVLIEPGSTTFTAADEGGGYTYGETNNVTIEFTAPTLIEVFSINVSLVDENSTELHWKNKEMRTKYHWDWVASERPEWTERVEVEGSWGDDISIDYTFTDLNPEQEYNMSWTIWTHPMPTDTFEQEMVIDGGFTIINPNSDGNYDAVVSFQMLEEWSVEDVCIEYEIAIDGVDGLLLDGTPWGQTLRKCVNLEPAGVGGLPSVSGFVTIISVLCAAIIFTPKRHSSDLNEHDES